MADNYQLLKQIGNLIDEKLEPIKKKQQDQGEVITSVKTLVEALGAGQREIREVMATKADVLDLGVKINSHRRRIETVEEKTGISHKN
jgi:hypothetical protein